MSQNLRTFILWCGLVGGVVGISWLGGHVLFAANSLQPVRPTRAAFDQMNQQTGSGFYYWDARAEMFVNVHDRRMVTDRLFARMFSRLNAVEESVRRLETRVDNLVVK